MVTDADQDTGFVIPMQAAIRLSNIRFQFLPQFFGAFTLLRNQRDALQEQTANLAQQRDEALGIAERRRLEVELLDQRLKETETVLKRRNFWYKFFRISTIALGVTTGVLLLTR